MGELWQMTATDLARMVKAREVSAREVCEDSLERLQAVNGAINAIVQEMPEQALAAADLVDERIAAGKDAGPLCGVPVTVKVNVDQAGFATTNGVRLQENLIAETDNPVVANLRKAGAVIVGRTNTPAFSLRWFCRNSLHGHTLNPRSPTITPGGSSGGAGAATAAGIGAIGHGTDIAGSVRYPAYACGIHGLRPGLGRVPAFNFSGPDRHIGAQLMAVSGPLARSIDDLELALSAMAAEDTRDPWWSPVPLELPAQAKRVALCVNPCGLETASEVETALRDAAKILSHAGWQVEEAECPDLREAVRMQISLWMAEYQRGGGTAIDDEADPDGMFVYQQLCKHCVAPDRDALLDVLQSRSVLTRAWRAFLAEYPVLLCPVSGELPFPDLLDVKSEAAFERVFEAQLTQIGVPFMGLPGLTVTTGTTDDHVPVGVQLVGGHFREDTLLRAGKDLEAAVGQPVPVDPAS